MSKHGGNAIRQDSPMVDEMFDAAMDIADSEDSVLAYFLFFGSRLNNSLPIIYPEDPPSSFLTITKSSNMSMPAKVDYPPSPPPPKTPSFQKEDEEENPVGDPVPPTPTKTEIHEIQTSDVILATAGYDDTIKLWEAHTGKLLRTLNHPCNYVTALEISPDGGLLVAGGHQCIKIYHTNNTNDEGKWMYIAAPATTVQLHPNQQELIIGDALGNVHIWNLRADKSETFTPATESVINDISVNPSGTHLAFGLNNTGNCFVIPLKEAPKESKNPIRTGICDDEKTEIQAHKKYALRCKFSPDGKILATTSADQTSKLWNTDDYSLKKELKVDNQRWVWDLAFSLDSQYLFTASSDNLARLWSLEKGKVVREYTGHQNALTCLAFRDVKAES
ncbi:MLST8 [Lepeophtheirus salmonis]|uniref:Target of rapamycin complex subunit lst8 n=1 Tax=Lepeophtheirus salmonis TaxID=72036 RepID=A0A7R8D5E4_LEPSM|nr:MLST8 [Lepeophtheirus salmonis]CAF3029817.1 MLST8 [Lepeophtheirus salmonis]